MGLFCACNGEATNANQSGATGTTTGGYSACQLRIRIYSCLLERAGIEGSAHATCRSAFALAIHKYQVKPFDGPALLYLRGTGRSRRRHREPTTGWGDLLSQLSIEVFPAEHLEHVL